MYSHGNSFPWAIFVLGLLTGGSVPVDRFWVAVFLGAICDFESYTESKFNKKCQHSEIKNLIGTCF